MSNNKIIISWNNETSPIMTAKAMGFKILNNNTGKIVIVWVPKSMLSDVNLDEMRASVPEWLWDKKINEIFNL